MRKGEGKDERERGRMRSNKETNSTDLGSFA